MEGHAVIEDHLKKQVLLRILPKKCPTPTLYSTTGPVLPICWMSYCKPDKSLISFELWGGVQNPSRWHRTIQFKCQNSARLVICHLSKATCIQTKCLTLFMPRILWTVYHVFPPPLPQHRAAAAAADAACVWSLGHRWSIIVSWIKIPVRLFFFAFFPSLYVLFGSIDIYVFLRF